MSCLKGVQRLKEVFFDFRFFRNPNLKYRKVSVGSVLEHFESRTSQIGSGLWFFLEPFFWPVSPF